MELLPVEILSKIFSYLKVKEFLNISEICKKFDEIIKSNFFMEKLSVDVTQFKDFETSTRNYINVNFGHLDEQQLWKCSDTIKSLETISPSVQRIKLDDVEMINSCALENLLMVFDNVKELHLEGIYLKNSVSSIKSIKLDNLKVLKFFYSSSEFLNLFTDIREQLKIIKICLVPHHDEAAKNRIYSLVTGILHNNRETLEKLNLYDVNFDDEFLDKTSGLKFQKLSKFSMSFISYLSPESSGFQQFLNKNANTLKKFKVRTFDHINQQQLKVLIDNAVNVRSLNLIICSFCDYEVFDGFKNLRNLEELKLQPTNYCNITLANIFYQKFIEDKVLTHRNTTMKHVTIKHLRISEEVISKIASSFPKVLTLKLSCNSEVDLNQIVQLKDKFKNVSKLILNDVNLIG
jgi:F-box-like